MQCHAEDSARDRADHELAILDTSAAADFHLSVNWRFSQGVYKTIDRLGLAFMSSFRMCTALDHFFDLSSTV
jgi:hypothetical protein